ncbi:uncharacterized protein LOC103742954 [Nannospalax galili]|uniref:uncharacterized protein LOC103742954 n=1 Tax=Nannospalax galili TaxID=1026970 RepID=UPI00111C9143|nr:uncharacterized protein LOC103742954 [Nannospalax galili]
MAGLDFTGSLAVTTPEQTVQKAKGETAYLPCKFSLSPEDQGPLDIEWLRLSGPDNEKVDRVIILYSVDKIYYDFCEDLKGRVHFTSNDIKSGDASITVTDVQLSDAGTYRCRVKKAPSVANRNLQLTVTDFTGSLTVTTPEQTVQKAKGETAYLPCKFSLSPEDQGPLDIEWLRLSGPDNEKVDRVVSVCLLTVTKQRSHCTLCSSLREGHGSGSPSAQACDPYRVTRIVSDPRLQKRKGSSKFFKTVQKAKGETAYLPCKFSLSPEDQGPLDIEWLRLSGPDNEKVDRVIILYSVDKIYYDFYQDLKGRVHFTSDDIKSGDASISITDVQLSDTGTSQCRVRKAPGVAKSNLQLTVFSKLLLLVTCLQ